MHELLLQQKIILAVLFVIVVGLLIYWTCKKYFEKFEVNTDCPADLYGNCGAWVTPQWCNDHLLDQEAKRQCSRTCFNLTGNNVFCPNKQTFIGDVIPQATAPQGIPTNCSTSNWSIPDADFYKCNDACNAYVKTRTRSVTKPATNGGFCDVSLSDSINCNGNPTVCASESCNPVPIYRQIMPDGQYYFTKNKLNSFTNLPKVQENWSVCGSNVAGTVELFTETSQNMYHTTTEFTKFRRSVIPNDAGVNVLEGEDNNPKIESLGYIFTNIPPNVQNIATLTNESPANTPYRSYNTSIRTKEEAIKDGWIPSEFLGYVFFTCPKDNRSCEWAEYGWCNQYKGGDANKQCSASCLYKTTDKSFCSLTPVVRIPTTTLTPLYRAYKKQTCKPDLYENCSAWVTAPWCNQNKGGEADRQCPATCMSLTKDSSFCGNASATAVIPTCRQNLYANCKDWVTPQWCNTYKGGEANRQCSETCKTLTNDPSFC